VADLTGVEMKVDRAKDHLRSLTRQIELVATSSDVHFEHSTRNGGRVHAYKVRGLPDVSPEWSATIGDCLHNARSALDHLAHAAVVALGGAPQYGPGGTSFPVVSCGIKPLKLKGLPNIPQAIGDALESVQPRNPSSRFIGEFIGAMSTLDNRDKHAQLLVVQYATNELDVAWGGMSDTPMPHVRVVQDGFSNGDEIITLTYPIPITTFDPSPRLPIRELLEPSLELWKHRDRMSVDKLLSQCISATERVIDKFRAILP
jgi:hypothetical protein